MLGREVTDIAHVSSRLATDVIERGIADLSNDALARNLLALRGAIDRLESAFAGFLAAFDERGACRDSGSVTTVSWLRHHAHMAGAAASERVRIARRLEQLPITSGGFAAAAHADPTSEADGSHPVDQPPGRPGLSYGHVAVIARMADDVGPDDAAAAEPILLEAARQVDPDALRKLARRLRHCVDPDGAQADANKAHTRRRLHVSETMDGLVVLDGLLDPESGAVLRTALNAAMTAPGPEDGRCAAHRRADALIDLAQHAMDAGQLPESGGVRHHVTITADAATLLPDGPPPGRLPEQEEGGGSTRPVRLSSEGGEDVADVRRARHRLPADTSHPPPADVESGAPMPSESARRIACDASFARMLLGPDSQPLDVGRSTRIIPTAMRRALNVRDGGCAYPRCDRPASWCEAHHREHWVDGGSTSLDNLVLLCRAHHRPVHDHGHAEIGAPP